MGDRSLGDVLEVVALAADFNFGAFSMLLRRLELTGERLGDLSVAELVNTIEAVRRDFNAVYGEVA